MTSMNGNTPHTLPDSPDIQHAHDILAQIINENEPPGFLDAQDTASQHQMNAALDVLCWVLGHENDSFGRNIKAIAEHLEGLGYTYGIDPDDYDN